MNLINTILVKLKNRALANKMKNTNWRPNKREITLDINELISTKVIEKQEVKFPINFYNYAG